jgi:hypothetical protein
MPIIFKFATTQTTPPLVPLVVTQKLPPKFVSSQDLELTKVVVFPQPSLDLRKDKGSSTGPQEEPRAAPTFKLV